MNRRDFVKTAIAGSVMLVSGGIVQASTFHELPHSTGEVEAWYGHHKMKLVGSVYRSSTREMLYLWELQVTPDLPSNLDCTIKCGEHLLTSISPHWRDNPGDTIRLSFVRRDDDCPTHHI